MKNLWRSVTLAALAALLTTGVASAQDYVRVTEVTVDKFQVLHNPTLYITGTITCEATGEVDGFIQMTVTQRDARGIDNSEFVSFRCSTEPTPWRVGANNFACEDVFIIGSESEKNVCWKPGAALVRVWISGQPDLAEQRVIVRR